MNITRSEAIVFSSFFKMIDLEPERLIYLTDSALAEFGKSVKKEEQKNKYLRKYIEIKFSSYRNEYFKIFLHRYIDRDIEILGAEPELFKCPCCEYKTLEKFSEYFICPVCFWEDDGTNSDDKYSTANRMLLGDAKRNFLTFKAIDEKSLAFLDEDRFLQFGK